MPQIIVRNIPDDVMDGLRELARRRGVSMEQEVRTLIADAVGQAARLREFRDAARRERARIARRATLDDSAPLVREDRRR